MFQLPFSRLFSGGLITGILTAGLLTASVAFAQAPPPPPRACPPGYHMEGPRGCLPNGPGHRPLCPPGMAWWHGKCHRLPPPPPHRGGPDGYPGPSGRP